ncbi:hypothetical protein BQ8482_130105 [Mesorhizobium delmotii]|uniref:Uncharacterized protein n=1 Tax=Mesorhizobium delmotii TaxID=1631247 RepID=A0A2P9AGI6_9HYPH|nr:hypothetical protein BQ8482_130105 [Mesorhizobium delmotii]
MWQSRSIEMPGCEAGQASSELTDEDVRAARFYLRPADYLIHGCHYCLFVSAMFCNPSVLPGHDPAPACACSKFIRAADISVSDDALNPKFLSQELGPEVSRRATRAARANVKREFPAAFAPARPGCGITGHLVDSQHD